MKRAASKFDYSATVQTILDRVSHNDIEAPTDRRRDVARPPGPSSIAFVSHAMFGNRLLPFTTEISKTYSQIAHFRLLREHAYFLTDPAFIVEVFSNNGRNTMKGRALQGAKSFLGNGLLTSNGDAHMHNRRLAQPAFHRDRITGYAEDMVSITAQHEKQWRDGMELDMAADMSELTLGIVGQTLFNSNLQGEAREFGLTLSEVTHSMNARLLFSPKIMSIDMKILTPKRKRLLESLARLDEIVQGMIDEHRHQGDVGDVLSMLVASTAGESSLTDAQIRDEAMTFVLAGHETTATSLSWMWVLLANNPEQAAWLHEELDAVLGGREPNLDDLKNLPRTHAVLNETIRLFPAGWIQGRRLLSDVEVGEWTLPRGAMVFASPWMMQRSERWWKDPEKFLPQRWITSDGSFNEDAPKVPKGVWFPFGWGNRKCIGEAFARTEAALVIATLTQHWTPEIIGETPEPLPGVVLRTENGIRMVLRKRYTI
jgi:cytochrome P450